MEKPWLSASDLEPGDTIGNLKILDMQSRKDVAAVGHERSGTTATGMVWVVRLRCTCGKEWEESLDRMPAKIKQWPRDCGCGASSPVSSRGRPSLPFGKKRMSVSVSLSQEVLARLDDYTVRHRVSFSQAVEALIVSALKEDE